MTRKQIDLTRKIAKLQSKTKFTDGKNMKKRQKGDVHSTANAVKLQPSILTLNKIGVVTDHIVIADSLGRMKFIFYITILSLLPMSAAFAQGSVGIKTNLLYGAYTYTPNLGMEIGLSRRTTLDISGGYNPWNLDNKNGDKKRVHWLVQPEFRYFFCSRFNGHFLGIHGLYSQYNIGGHELPMLFGKGSEEYRHEGLAYGGGITYGYQFLLGKHWNLELSVGAGVVGMDYDKFDCINCGRKIGSEKRTYYGPTKAAISFIYIIK